MTQRIKATIYHVINVLIPVIFYVCAGYLLKLMQSKYDDYILDLDIEEANKFFNRYILPILQNHAFYFLQFLAIPTFCVIYSVRLSKSKIALAVYPIWNALFTFV